VAWLRNGTAIPGATATTYTTTGDDVGATIAAQVTAARDEATVAARELAAIEAELTAAVAQPADDDRAIRKVKDLARSARPVRDRIKVASEKAAVAAQATDAAARAMASPSDAATQAAAHAKAVADEVAAISKEAIATVDKLDASADDYATSEAGDVEMLVASANTSIASGKLSDAKHDLDKAADLASASGESYPAMKWSYGRLYDAMAKRAKDDEKVRLFKKAKQSYDDFARSGSGANVARAKARGEELAEEIAELEGATP
jgi:hypothetical protein